MTDINAAGLEIIAQQGLERFIIVPKGVGPETRQAQILDLDGGFLSRPLYLQSILARGPWEPYNSSQDLLPDLLERVRPL